MEQKHYTALSVWITPGWLWFLCLHLSWWGPELSQCLPQRNPGTSVLLSWWKNTNIVGLPGTMGPTPSLVRALRDPTATQRSQGAQGKERCILGFGVRFGWRFFGSFLAKLCEVMEVWGQHAIPLWLACLDRILLGKEALTCILFLLNSAATPWLSDREQGLDLFCA